MAEIVIEIPRELERELPRIRESLREFVKVKVFEFELKRNKELQRFVFEALASKSKLTKEEALKLGEKISKGMLQELKEKGLV